MSFFKIETTPDISQRHYKQVTSSSVDTSDHVIPNGETYQFIRFYGNASESPNTIVCIFWDKDGLDEDLLFTTHNDSILDKTSIEKTGNGVKKITIVLKNDLLQDEWLGAAWEAIIV